MQSTLLLFVTLLFLTFLSNFIFISNFTIYNIIVYASTFFIFYSINYYFLLLKECFNFLSDYSYFFICIMSISILYIVFIYTTIFLARNQIFKNENQKYQSQKISYSLPSKPPKPPKKNWKKKLKEHFYKYKELYIGAGITLSAFILYYYYGTRGGSEPGSSNFQFISETTGDTNNINNVTIINNHLNTGELLYLYITNNNNLINSDYLSLFSKYFLVFGIIHKVNEYHPLLTYLINVQNLTNSFNYLPFIINNNIIDFTLVAMNKYYGVCSQIGFMSSNLNFLNELNIFNDFKNQFKLEAELTKLVPLDIHFNYRSFINYYGIILKVLNQNNLTIDILHKFYLSQLLKLPLELRDLFDQIDEKIKHVLTNYLLSIEGKESEFDVREMYSLIIYVLEKEYPATQFINKKHLLFLIFQLLESFYDQYKNFSNNQFNIIENASNFKEFYTLYLILLSYFKITSCNVIYFFSFLISHNCIESIQFTENSFIN